MSQSAVESCDLLARTLATVLDTQNCWPAAPSWKLSSNGSVVGCTDSNERSTRLKNISVR
jgi:hypothetical protein